MFRLQVYKTVYTFQAIYSSVIPGEVMRGNLPQMVQFPQWLGKNSTRNKTDRIIQELRTHMRLQYVTYIQLVSVLTHHLCWVVDR